MNASSLITLFVVAVLAIVFIGVIATQTNTNSDLVTQTENLDISGARLDGGALNSTYNMYLTDTGVNDFRNDYSECIPQTITFKNSSGTVLTDPTDYAYVYNTGRVRVSNVNSLNNSVSNTTTATYTTCPDTYLTQPWGRSVSKLVVGFLVLMLLIAFVWGIYQYMPRNE